MNNLNGEQLDRPRVHAAEKLSGMQAEIDEINDALRFDADDFDLPDLVVPTAQLNGGSYGFAVSRFAVVVRRPVPRVDRLEGVQMTGELPDFDAELAACTGLDDPRWRAASLIADAWGPALALSYELGRADGYTAGYWQSEHEMFGAWHRVAVDVQDVLAQPTQDELAARRRGAA